MNYFAWWIYLLIGVAGIGALSFLELHTWVRILLSLGVFWYGMSAGIGLHKENLLRKATLRQRAHDALKQAGKL